MSEQAAVKRDVFPITAQTEIRVMLQRLVDQHCLFTANFGDEHRFLVTTLLGFSADGRELYLDASPHEAINEAVLAVSSLLMTTQLDRVELRFTAGPATRVIYDGAPAFRIPLPIEMVYLQWREYFRLTPPISKPLTCTIPVVESDETHVLQTRVIDVSIGGVAVHVAKDFEVFFVPRAQFQHCHIQLPDGTDIDCDLMVRYVEQTADARGLLRMRAGCQFVNPSAQVQTAMQRYVTKIERERIARRNGVI